MWKANWQSVRKRPISVYILIVAVIALDLSLLYIVNLELLPYVFGLDRELYRKTLVTLAADTMTTALGVCLGLMCFHFVVSLQGAERQQADSDHE
jgi:hypothetical protein